MSDKECPFCVVLEWMQKNISKIAGDKRLITHKELKLNWNSFLSKNNSI